MNQLEFLSPHLHYPLIPPYKMFAVLSTKKCLKKHSQESRKPGEIVFRKFLVSRIPQNSFSTIPDRLTSDG